MISPRNSEGLKLCLTNKSIQMKLSSSGLKRNKKGVIRIYIHIIKFLKANYKKQVGQILGQEIFFKEFLFYVDHGYSLCITYFSLILIKTTSY